MFVTGAVVSLFLASAQVETITRIDLQANFPDQYIKLHLNNATPLDAARAIAKRFRMKILAAEYAKVSTRRSGTLTGSAASILTGVLRGQNYTLKMHPLGGELKFYEIRDGLTDRELRYAATRLGRRKRDD